jgi:hypothetical protein
VGFAKIKCMLGDRSRFTNIGRMPGDRFAVTLATNLD